MVKRCAYGICKSDSRYPDRLHGVKFLPFPKPKRNRDKCLRWIRACGRPHSQLSTERITKDTYVCSKHFHDQEGPSRDFPDPRPSDGSAMFRARRGEALSTMTFHSVYTDLDMLSHLATIRQLEEEIATLKEGVHKEQKEPQSSDNLFNPQFVNTSQIKNLFHFYTGFPFCTFLVLFNFLFPDKDVNPIKYSESRRDIQNMSLTDQLFLVLCRLGNGFELKDLAFRFSISTQSASVIFKDFVHYMYLKLGHLSFWPHRNVIIDNMPKDYFSEFPTSMCIIDCTEIKTERPSAFDSQAQCFSDYKSNTTLKSLIATYPCGSVMFVSMLFSGCVSDNEICKDSGFYTLLSKLKGKGFLLEGDAIMADKGFRIDKELSGIGLKLNIPPFSSSVSQMSVSDVAETRKIAKHRIHVERAINRIKNFKLVNRKIPVSLFHNINEIWFVCAMLTNFLPTLVQS